MVAAVAASWMGYSLTGSHDPLAPVAEVDASIFPISDPVLKAGSPLSSSLTLLETYLLSHSESEALTFLPEIEVVRDFHRSEALITWLRGEMENGDAMAARLMGLLEWRGGAEGSVVQDAFRKAFELGDLESASLLALRACDGAPKRESLEGEVMILLSRSAESGIVSACELMGMLLVDSEPARAVRFLEKASKGGSAEATYRLGLCYAHGNGIDPSEELAADAFRSSAENGCLSGMVAWGRCLETGFGTEASSTEATRWMKMAALHEEPAAEAWLSRRSEGLALLKSSED